MERSSPLAAMQPPALPGHWGRQHESSLMDSNFLRPCQYEPKNFNFRDMSMFKPKNDYFNFNPVRGSSPTASLAADLSQNFHIDQSPQLPTPRRSLFTAANLQELNEHRKNVITPPVPSSSPGIENDPMDVSPLPHKPPFLRVDVVVPTPDPIGTPTANIENISSATTEDLSPLTVVPSRQSPPRPRRISNATRPSLKKGHSTSSVPPQSFRSISAAPALEEPFRFGNASRTCLASRPLLEAFAESPPSERKLPPSSSNPSLIGTAPIPQLTFPPANGSPIAPIRRGPSAARRPSCLNRRTQSMQCNNPLRPTIRTEKRSCTEGSISLSRAEEEAISFHKPRLPHFKKEEEPDELPRITAETLVNLQNGAYKSELPGGLTVIDCRFEYEYQGGHIDGAINFNDKEQLASYLFASSPTINSAPAQLTYDMTAFPTDNISAPFSAHPGFTSSFSPEVKAPKALVLHCEYSAHRAPLMAKFLRQRDRAHNSHRYPELTYPEIYILDGGYSAFFKSFEELCFPRRYVQMNAQEHKAACENGMAKVKKRGKLSRAQTYAFGQSGCGLGVGMGIPHQQPPTLQHSNSNNAVPTVSKDMVFEDLPCAAPTASADMSMAMDIDVDFGRPGTAESQCQSMPILQQRFAPRRLPTY